MNPKLTIETCKNTVESYYAHSLNTELEKNNTICSKTEIKTTVRLILVPLHKEILPILLKTIKNHETLAVLQPGNDCKNRQQHRDHPKIQPEINENLPKSL